jgi:uncharacterized DUF497 family protein
MIRFEWDEAKNKANFRKHGIWFEQVESVFDDSLGRLFADPIHSIAEERYILVGKNNSGRLLVVAHLFDHDEELVRIISARHATKLERKFYEEGI